MSSNLDSPVMSESSMVLDFLQFLEIFSELGIDLIGDQLVPGTFLRVVLSVQEPLWDVVLGRSGEDIVDFLDFFFSDFSSSLVEVNSCFLQEDVGESSADSLDGGEGEHNLDCSLNISVLDSQNMSEVGVFNWDEM